MKKFLALGLITVMVTALAGCGAKPAENAATSATEAQATQETLAADVKNQLDEVLTNEEYEGVVQITKGNDVIYQYANGDDDNGKPLTIDASMPIGSTSKQFCAAAVMLLCDQKKLSVEDTLDRYFPDYQYAKKMTIKDLLTMSSGIPNYLDIIDPSMVGKNEAENIQTVKKVLFEEELRFEPGDDYSYSNSNFFLLADIVEQVSGVAYHEFLRKNIFEPLEMTHTGFVEELTDAPAWAFAISQDELPNETLTPGLAKGAGDIVSNAADMDKWMHGLSGGKVISEEAFRQMTENINPYSTEEYGYGLWHMPYGGVGHVGQITPHFGTVDYFNTDRDVYLFAASNSSRGMWYVQEIPQALMSILLEEN